jgi:hypothetical protein
VTDWYCENNFSYNTLETLKNDVSSVINEKKDITLANNNLKANKNNLFICLEVKNRFWLKSDENRCATMMSLVSFAETEDWKTGVWVSMNNLYWIKLPTDKSWLVWKWQVWNWNHIIFETQEMSSYAFAYYYMKYHINRNFNNFVDIWVGWDNIKYKNYLKINYDFLYNQYLVI